MNAFNEAWWAEICRWSYRDQVSFPYVLSKFPNLKISFVQLNEIRDKLYHHGLKTHPKILDYDCE